MNNLYFYYKIKNPNITKYYIFSYEICNKYHNYFIVTLYSIIEEATHVISTIEVVAKTIDKWIIDYAP